MRFKKYDVVKHFKHETLTDDQKKQNIYLYQILAFPVRHTETGEDLVVYKALYDCHENDMDVRLGQVFARPISQFFSGVDTVKYPNIKQTYRFELVKHMCSEIHDSMIADCDLTPPCRKHTDNPMEDSMMNM